MTTITPAAHRPLADALLPRTAVVSTALVLGGALLTAGAAQVSVPIWPVPITGQTLAVLLVGSALGARRGALSMLVYALLGVVGLPVFADGSAGVGVLVGPSGGYIVGFVAGMAWLAVALGLDLQQTLQYGLYPFVLGGVVKTLIGAGVISLGWTAALRSATRR
ncbi:biotin transporter BioY [Curtobacterium sp. MCLR17_040]|uniref:biotin transporter BioY n=1 Tax=Curtobacterium sp. MCLR17_040 TaxID=2175625 RepID=UPI000DA8F214|nr:biotin transporter BioY [Curtobacterium sp. MCLR17_040]PZF02850.1 biotin transporter BioY [Curtobacterium sp. MCLR17_040]